MSSVAGPSNQLRPGLQFGKDQAFWRTLQARVDAHFAQTGRSRRDSPEFYIKAAILILWTVASYLLLVFASISAWQAVFLAISLGLSSTLTAFNVYHDASHNAASRYPIVNRLGAFLMDIVGASSYVWVQKHNKMHHVYANIHEFDCDIDVGAIARFSVHQPKHWYHRLQHLYLWPLNGLYAFQWQYFEDVKPLLFGRIGVLQFLRPRGADLVQFIIGKGVFFSLAFLLPLTLHSLPAVLGCYFLVYYINGWIFVCVVQLSHITDCTAKPYPPPAGSLHQDDWATHQVSASCDFSHESRVLTWCLGGLNYQIEHHLFPQIVHTRYPEIEPIVRDACLEFGVSYNYKETLWAALKAHHNYLRQMGNAVA